MHEFRKQFAEYK